MQYNQQVSNDRRKEEGEDNGGETASRQDLWNNGPWCLFTHFDLRGWVLFLYGKIQDAKKKKKKPSGRHGHLAASSRVLALREIPRVERPMLSTYFSALNTRSLNGIFFGCKHLYRYPRDNSHFSFMTRNGIMRLIQVYN